ncbi:MAG: hypothetical protein J2P37_19215 [Ktedonobacteraceae bacterium]|nr:hypothetical protein [Ktedonobacteraceae bacterium]MBO0794849.1 hypothetical protein [Ktedonobacteraceae bacterium]
MQMRVKSWFILLVGGIMLSFLLTACSLDFLGLGGSTPKATPTTPTSSLTTYQGDGFTIGYPQGWKVSKNGSQVQFTDTTGAVNLIVQTAPNPGGTVPADTFIQGGLQGFKGTAKNYKEESIAPTTTVNGVTWNQGAASGDVTESGQTANAKLVVMVTNHPEHDPATKAFMLIYGSPTAAFDLSNTSYFQPMVQSFKFSA